MNIKLFHTGMCVSAIALFVGMANAETQDIHADMFAQASASQQQASAGSVDSGIANIANASIDYLLDTVGDDLPDWAQRFEFSVDLQENLKPEWSVLTVQPLYQSPGQEHTVFTQLSQRRYNYLGTDRDVTNVGFGYRKLFADNTVLAGVNTFFDYEWERSHQRGGVGAELKWAGFDFTTNYYKAISDKTGRGLTGDIQEEVLDGYDVELGVQVPYLPWATLYGKRYVWNAISAAEDIEGWVGSVEAKLHQNFLVEAGYADDNYMNSREHFAKLTFTLPFGQTRPAMLSSEFVSDKAWEMRDMRGHTLDKVRRENKIILERSGSGVVITRGG